MVDDPPETFQVVPVLKDLPAHEGDRHRFDPCVQKIPSSRKWQLIPAYLPGKFHGQSSLLVYSLWGCKEQDMGMQHAWACTLPEKNRTNNNKNNKKHHQILETEAKKAKM